MKNNTQTALMVIIIVLLVLILGVGAFFIGANTSKTEKAQTVSAAETEKVDSKNRVGLKSDLSQKDLDEIKSLVMQWDLMHEYDHGDVPYTSLIYQLYSKKVSFYGEVMTPSQIEVSLAKMYRKYIFYNQTSQDLDLEELPNGDVKVSFNKHCNHKYAREGLSLLSCGEAVDNQRFVRMGYH